jgi:serine/threonine-protein kinase
VLYECLSGLRPFTGATAGEVFSKIRSGKCPALKKVAPGAPAELRAIVTRAMKRKPKDRYADISELRRALDRYLSAHLHVAQGALLLAYLKLKGKVSESEVLARLTQTEMSHADIEAGSYSVPTRRGGWGLMLLLAALVGGLWVTRPEWLPWVQAMLHR